MNFITNFPSSKIWKRAQVYSLLSLKNGIYSEISMKFDTELKKEAYTEISTFNIVPDLTIKNALNWCCCNLVQIII